VGAFVSGVFIPRFTTRRDERRKALEIKTELVSDMSEVVMSFVMAVRFAVLGAVSQTEKEYEDSYKAWERDRAVLGTKLEAYFPGTDERDIGSNWDEFAEGVKVVHEVARIQDLDVRRQKAIELLWTHELDPGNDQTEFEKAWSVLETQTIFDRKRELITTVMGAPLRVDRFQEPPLRARVVRLGSRVFR